MFGTGSKYFHLVGKQLQVFRPSDNVVPKNGSTLFTEKVCPLLVAQSTVVRRDLGANIGPEGPSAKNNIPSPERTTSFHLPGVERSAEEEEDEEQEGEEVTHLHTRM